MSGLLQFDSCSLAGGGEKGAFEAGCLLALWELLAKVFGFTHEQIARLIYIWAGVSAGAINCAAMAQGWHPEKLCGFWREKTTSDILGSFFFGWVQGFFNGGLYKTDPLEKLLGELIVQQKIVDRGAKVRLGAVSLTTGRYEVGTEASPQFHSWILRSTVHPVAMVYVKADGQLWTDGGVRNKTPLGATMKAGGRRVFVSVPSTKDPERWDNDDPNILQRSLREFDLILHEAHKDDIEKMEIINWAIRAGAPEARNLGYKEIEYVVVRPDRPPKTDLLKFTSEQADQLIQAGYDATYAKFSEV